MAQQHARRRRLASTLLLAALLLAALPGVPARAGTPPPARLVWAWERPEALETLPPDVGIAVVRGFMRLRGGGIAVLRGRRFPLGTAPGRPQPVAVLHIEVDRTAPLDWTDRLAREVVDAALSILRGAAAVQLDMEVRRSQRPALLAVLAGLRAGLAPGTTLSMTALASWCDTETWLADAPVDEVVPMLFRMGPAGARLRARLAAGGDFALPRCRTAVGVSLDSPVAVPPGRRLYIFNPHPWTAAAIAVLPSG